MLPRSGGLVLLRARSGFQSRRTKKSVCMVVSSQGIGMMHRLLQSIVQRKV